MTRKILIPGLDLEEEYLSRFSPDELLNDEITLIGQKQSLRRGKWFYENQSPLWNYNLNYFEYGIALAARYRRTGEIQYKRKICCLIENWCETQRGGVGWHPYPISLRIPNWLIIYELLEEEPPQNVIDNLYSQYRYLIKNREIHLLGNHYLENLKTILIGSLYFGERHIYEKYWPVFVREVEEEVLGDGVHFERSLMYHKIIMEDMMRLAKMMRRSEAGEMKFLILYLEKMATAIHSLEKGMGKTPHFNDAADGVAKNKDALLNALEEEWRIRPGDRDSFECAGYYKLYSQTAAVMVDCGEIGPVHMTGHGHCDALSFELSVNKKPILVNSGTYAYQGTLRSFFRSTRAHNTAWIHGCEQSEVWGEHRTARRITNVQACIKSRSGACGNNYVEGSYRTYQGYGHTRRVKLLGENRWQIEDKINGPEHAGVSVYFHAFPGLIWIRTAERFKLTDGERDLLELETEGADRFFLHTEGELCHYSQCFGRLARKEVLEIQAEIKNGSLQVKTKINILVQNKVVSRIRRRTNK